jgi:carboxyl-terminal processing protease
MAAIFAAAVAIVLLRPGVVQSGGDRVVFNETVIGDVRDIIAWNYVDEPEEFDRKLYYGALQGMTDVLDPHSVFLPPKDREELEIDTQGKFGGLGILIEKPLGKNGPIVVVTPFLGTPASKMGIQPGDRIVEIEGQPTLGMTLAEAVGKLRGSPGTSVRIKVMHGGHLDARAFRAGRVLGGSRLVSVDGRPVAGLKESEVIEALAERRGQSVSVVVVPEVLTEARDVELERAVIKVPNIEFPRIIDEDAKIGYLHLARFQEDTAKSIRRAVDELRAQGMRALVLDLRWNGGGLLQASVEAAKLFLDKGAVVVSTRARVPEGGGAPKREFRVRFAPRYPKDELPMAVLVNGASASAAEILAAAIRDNRRGVTVGERTFGKGSVQKLYDVKLGEDPETGRRLVGWLKLTTEKYYTPSGESIQREMDSETWGVEPDVVLEMSEAEAIDLRRQWEKQKIAEQQGEGEDPPAKEGEGFRDTQLERAVEILRAVLVLTTPGPVEGAEVHPPAQAPVPAAE